MALRHSLLVLCMAAVLMPARSAADVSPDAEQPEGALTLEQALALALRDNPDVLAAVQNVRGARGRAIQSRSFAPPSVFLDVDEVAGDNPGEAGVASLGLAQSFELGGKRGLRGTAAGLEVEALAVEEQGVRLRVAARVREQYYLSAFLERNTRDLERSLQLLEEFVQSAGAKFAAGAVPYLDVVRAEIELGRARNDFLLERRDLLEAKYGLNLLLGRSGATPCSLATPLAHVALTTTEEEAVRRATEGTRLSRLRLLLQLAEASRRLAGRARVPDLEVSAAAQRLRDGDETTAAWAAGLGFNVPAPWWGAPAGLVEETEAERTRLEVELAAAEREVESAARLAYETARSAELQVKAFETTILDSAEAELKAGIQAYGTGAVDSLNLLDIYRTYLQSRTEYNRSLYLYVSALARLEVAGDSESLP